MIYYDVDGDGSVDALVDGILIFRYIAGFRGDDLIDGALTISSVRDTAAACEGYLEQIYNQCDINGDGRIDISDAMLIIRAMFGSFGATLLDGAISAGSIRTTSDEILAYFTKMTTDTP